MHFPPSSWRFVLFTAFFVSIYRRACRILSGYAGARPPWMALKFLLHAGPCYTVSSALLSCFYTADFFGFCLPFFFPSFFLLYRVWQGPVVLPNPQPLPFEFKGDSFPRETFSTLPCNAGSYFPFIAPPLIFPSYCV